MNKTQTAIRLSDADKAFLGEMGGLSKGVRDLIAEKRERMEGAKKKKTAEEKFMERIIIPGEGHLSDLYQAFLVSFIKGGNKRGSIDYYEPRLCGTTGYDGATVRKMFRKLSSSGFIKSEGFLFRPTIRLVNQEAHKGFQEVYEDYAMFIQKAEQYQDWLEDDGAK